MAGAVLPAAGGRCELARAARQVRRPYELYAYLAEYNSTRRRLAAAIVVQAAGIVQRSEDLVASPEYRRRGFHRWYHQGEIGQVPYACHQFKIAGYPTEPSALAW